MLRLQHEWSAEPSPARRADLLAILDTPFGVLADDQHSAERATLTASFADALLRVELDRCLPGLGELGLTELVRYLRAYPGRRITRLALVPYGRLALFPLPAALIQLDSAAAEATPSTSAPAERLGDLFELTIAPSARSYSIALARAAAAGDLPRQPSDAVSPTVGDGTRSRRTDLLAIGNPLPLPFGMKGP